MKASFIKKTGGIDVIEYGDLPINEPAGTQVLVRVKAVSVNPIDVYIRAGLVKFNLPFPYILGCDVAGVIEKIGPQVTRFKVGDKVWGSNQGLSGRQGTFSEFALVEECWLYPKPDSVSFEEAAAISLVGITAHLGLVKHAQVRAGDIVFVNGGGGSVGTMVIQMARLLGARVIASTSGEGKIKLCADLGVEAVVDYKKEDLCKWLKAIYPDGVSIWWENNRNPDLSVAVKSLSENGRLIVLAGRDATPSIPLGEFYVKQCVMRGFVMFKASSDEQLQCAQDINRWMASGRLKAIIDRVLPLSKTAEAHKVQEDYTIRGIGKLTGKIVVVP